jgi:sigma-B regulation protein RsbU (phosphoserine phosphatase)
MTPPPRQLQFFQTLPGRLFLLSAGLFLVLRLIQFVTPLPVIAEIFRRVVAVAALGSGTWLLALAIAQNRRRLLWRVRRKLILSYMLVGLVPVVLVLMFVVFGGWLLYINVASYLFRDGLRDFVEDVYIYAESSAVEIGRSPQTIRPAIERKYANLASTYPQLSLAVMPIPPLDGDGDLASFAKAVKDELFAAGPWEHASVPTHPPGWMTAQPRAFSGIVAVPPPSPTEEWRIVIRAAVPTPDRRRLVIVDLPLDTDIAARLHESTQTRIAGLVVSEGCGGTGVGPTIRAGGLFRRSVAFMDCTDWQRGTNDRVTVSLEASPARLYRQLSSGMYEQQAIAVVLLLIGLLLLIVQTSALVTGTALARTITSAIHELFAGTERVQQGDFTHRIKIESRDQLGDLADSFNRMSASIEHLLHVQREKQRLDDELRIARDIQKSLLPTEPPRLEGLTIADLCEPAREVGGDYYDFFELGPNHLGVLVADVAGKGTSAALYMAELKGLMLALSHTQRSPRQLLIDVNRRLAGHLDNRSFITMTYLVLDLAARTLTCARAGHTPLVVASNGGSEVITPAGMVLGLRFPGAADRFERMLEEHTRPLNPGDAIVLYTDGVTEAMDSGGELFGDAALARVLASHHHLDAAGIRERVLREVKGFVGVAEPHDDMTMVILKIADDAGDAARMRAAS